jgi:hypothetical protein
VEDRPVGGDKEPDDRHAQDGVREERQHLASVTSMGRFCQYCRNS